MFKTRLLSGMVLVLGGVSLFYISNKFDLPILLLFSTLAIAWIGMFELYRVMKVEKSLAAALSYVMAAVFYCNIKWHFIPYHNDILLVMIYIILLMFIFVFSYPKYNITQISGVFFGFFYVAVMLSFIYKIQMMPNGFYLSLLIFICSWGCDTCAYCFGKLFGKHKMSPILSPKKSIEGAVGGVFGTAVLSAIYSLCMKSTVNITNKTIIVVAIISAIAGLVSMVGDLTASAIKRHYDIKDYGKIIPGHGGVMDRFDSVIITAPIIYYLSYFFI